MMSHEQEFLEMPEENSSALEDAKRRLANACKVLVSIQEMNRRDGVLNEHVLHSETVAEKLVEKLKKEVTALRDMLL